MPTWSRRRASAKPGIRLIASIEEMRGLIKEKVGDADGAIEHYKASVAVEPERELPLKRLAELYGMRKDFINGAHMDGALRGHQAARSWPSIWNARRLLPCGEGCSQRGQGAAARGSRLTRTRFWARYRWAQLFEEQKDNKQAALQYETAMQLRISIAIRRSISRLAKLYQADGRTRGRGQAREDRDANIPDKFRAVPSIR